VATTGISGLAVAAGAAGGLLLYSGINDVPLIDAIREVAAGRTPTPRPPKTTDVNWAERIIGGPATRDTAPGGTAAVTTFVAAAAAQIGKPYKWGAEGPDSFDCSGLVVFCLNRAGINVPRLVTWTFATWSGAHTVKASEAAAGDLVMYSGHMGIMSGPGQMIDAPRAGKDVSQRPIWKGQGGPWYRRVYALHGQRPPATGRGQPQQSKPR
jgi:cell wall-associated NlpC family hydrolase